MEPKLFGRANYQAKLVAFDFDKGTFALEENLVLLVKCAIAGLCHSSCHTCYLEKTTKRILEKHFR